MNAYGSSSRASATPTAVQWGSGDTIGERKVSLVCQPTARSARRRLPSRGSLGSHFPTFRGTIRRYDCHHAPLGELHLSLASRYLVCFQTFVVSLPGSCPGGSPEEHARAFGHPVPQSGNVIKETGGSPTFPSSPSEDMPRSQTPVVSCALAMAHPGLLPSSACKPSASPQRYPFRGSITRPAFSLHPAPYGPLRGGTRVRY
jgi:hypothetical protein